MWHMELICHHCARRGQIGAWLSHYHTPQRSKMISNVLQFLQPLLLSHHLSSWFALSCLSDQWLRVSYYLESVRVATVTLGSILTWLVVAFAKRNHFLTVFSLFERFTETHIAIWFVYTKRFVSTRVRTTFVQLKLTELTHGTFTYAFVTCQCHKKC